MKGNFEYLIYISNNAVISGIVHGIYMHHDGLYGSKNTNIFVNKNDTKTTGFCNR